jgi:hypothetical protein
VLLVRPLLRRGSLTPTTLRGPAPNGHPCPDGALAASMRLGPLRIVCVQPAPKSRLAVTGLPCTKIKSRSKADVIPCRSALDRDGVLSVTLMHLIHRNSRASALLQLIFIKPVDSDRAHAPRGYASRDALRPPQAKASPSGRSAFCGTGFSREEASLHTLNCAARHPTPYRVKPVQLGEAHLVGPASAGKRPVFTPSIARRAIRRFPG